MKIVFFGSSGFSVPSLERIFESPHEILAVVTQPDREKGRHLRLASTPVKSLAVSKGLNVYQPESLKDSSAVEYLRSLNADLFIVVSFGQILPKEVLDIPAIYCINLHPSLLPKYRGAAPINRAIINGEKKTGLTIIKINERMDAGDILLQRTLLIEAKDTAETLTKRFSELGAILLLDAVRFIEEDRVRFKKQNEKRVTEAPKLKKEDGLIDWGRSALEIHNKVRGTVPWPGAYTYFNKKRVNIWSTSILGGEAAPGEITEAKEELIVGTKKGLLKIEEIQFEGKKRMKTEEFLRGCRDMVKGATFNGEA